jgi:hypothetical protein
MHHLKYLSIVIFLFLMLISNTVANVLFSRFKSLHNSYMNYNNHGKLTRLEDDFNQGFPKETCTTCQVRQHDTIPAS